jgi:alkylation response protein AidB-like acyl-CoA dehydrogenase
MAARRDPVGIAEAALAEVCTKALQVCGGRGYHSRRPVQRYLRDAHAGGLMATTLEAGRDFVGKLLLGLDPAGPE